MKKLLFLFVLITAINVSSQESVLLRVNYKKGDVLDVKMEHGTITEAIYIRFNPKKRDALKTSLYYYTQ